MEKPFVTNQWIDRCEPNGRSGAEIITGQKLERQFSWRKNRLNDAWTENVPNGSMNEDVDVVNFEIRDNFTSASSICVRILLRVCGQRNHTEKRRMNGRNIVLFIEAIANSVGSALNLDFSCQQIQSICPAIFTRSNLYSVVEPKNIDQ